MRSLTRLLVPTLLVGIIIPFTFFTMRSSSNNEDEDPVSITQNDQQTFTSFNSARQIKQDHPLPARKASRRAKSTAMQRHIKRQCSRHGLPTSLNDDFDPKIFKKFIVDDKHKLIYCSIAKVACTTWQRVFIVLTGKVGTKNPMDLAPYDIHRKHEKLLTRLSDLPKDQILHRLRTYFKFVFVREPFERIVSAFRNKFADTYSPKNYFQNVYGRSIIQWYRGNKDDTNPKITFSEFIDYLVDPKPPINTNEHWELFHKLCIPCLVDYNFVGRLENVEKDSDFIFRKTGLTDVVHFPNRNNSNYKKEKSGFVSKDFYSQVSTRKIIQLYDTYKVDFDIFKYTLPEDVKMLMNKTLL